jgi:DNA-directed RNA polymerase subunit N (RpoN/RPB10)
MVWAVILCFQCGEVVGSVEASQRRHLDYYVGEAAPDVGVGVMVCERLSL